MTDNADLREKLLSAEVVSADLKMKYEARVKNLLERPLKAHERVAWTLAAVGSVCISIFFVCMAVRAPGGFPLVGRLLFIAGTVFPLGWTVLSVVILRRGTARMKWDSNVSAGLTWMFLVVMMTADLLLGSSMTDVARGTQLILTGTVFLIMFGHMVPLNRINQAELNLREDMLRLQLQIAELAQRLPQDRPADRKPT